MGESAVRGLIRLLVTVGILAAVYFLIVSPILDTTNETIDRAFDASSDLQESINEQLGSGGLDRVLSALPAEQARLAGDAAREAFISSIATSIGISAAVAAAGAALALFLISAKRSQAAEADGAPAPPATPELAA